MSNAEMVDLVLQNTEPLKHPRGERLPLYVWALMGAGTEDEAKIERLLARLNDRGMAMVSTWNHKQKDRSLAEGLRIGTIQKRLGLRVNVNANALLHRFFNGDPRTAHVTDTGDPFFDTSFSKDVSIGCPFALESRYPEIKARVEFFAREYKKQGIDVNFAFADWEIDGPMEWNGAWESAQKCRRCREQIPTLDDFSAFQRTLRKIRSDLQREVYADALKSFFPDIRVGNYAVYPRTDFTDSSEPVPLQIDGRTLYVPRSEGQCQILTLEQ